MDNDVMSKIKSISDALEKSKKRKVIRSFVEKDFIHEGVEYFSSGDLGIDIALSGGFPLGRIIKISGKKGCGKSTLIAKAMVVFTRILKKPVFLLDMENAYTANWLSALGADLSLINFAVAEDLEESFDILESIYMSGIYGLIVYDSLSSAAPRAELDISNEDFTAQALKARLANRLFRKLQGRQNSLIAGGDMPPTFMFANHIFVNPNDRFMKDVTPGGHHQDNASSVVISLYKNAWIRDKGEADSEDSEKPSYGFFTTLRVQHTKTGVPNRTWKFGIISEPFLGHSAYDVFHGYSIATIGIRLGVILQSGAWYSVPETGHKFQGISNLYEAIVTDTALADFIINKIKFNLKENFKGFDFDIKFNVDIMNLSKNFSSSNDCVLDVVDNIDKNIAKKAPAKKGRRKK